MTRRPPLPLAPAALCLLLVAGCPPPVSAPSVAPPTAAPKSTRAYFARLTSLTVGGDFDGSGTEEIGVHLEANDDTRTLFSGDLDLPLDRLETFPIAGGPWLELPAVQRLKVGITVYDVDATGSEVVCGGEGQVALSAYGPDDVPGRLEVALGTIRGTSQPLAGAGTSFTIHGARCALALVQVDRRDAPDPTSRRLTRETFGALLAAKAPKTAAEASDLESLLERTRQGAQAAAERTTHTYLRDLLPRLAEGAGDLAETLRQVGGGRGGFESDLERIERHLASIDRRRPEAEQGYADARAVVDAGAPAREAGALSAAEARARTAAASLRKNPEGFLLVGALEDYARGLNDALLSLDALPRSGEALAAYQKAVLAEAGPGE